MAATSKTRVTAMQVYEIYITASPEVTWEAITSPEWFLKYGEPGFSAT
jgi:hypothetical protein